MSNVGTYLVTENIAARCGLLGKRYYTKEGLVVLDKKDFMLLRMTPEEYVNGIKGVRLISSSEALELIKENNYRMNKAVESNEKNVESDKTTE